MKKRKDFCGNGSGDSNRQAKTLASAKGVSIRKYLADLVMDDAKKQREKK